MNKTKTADDILNEFDRKLLKGLTVALVVTLSLLLLFGGTKWWFTYDAGVTGTKVSVKVVERNAVGTRSGTRYSTLFEDKEGNKYLIEGEDAYSSRDTTTIIVASGGNYLAKED